MNLIEFLKKEIKGFSRMEKFVFPISIALVIFVSILLKDSKIALISSVAGISYTILAGKGKISCYFIGMTGTICYSYLSFVNSFFGNFALYAFYYLPMEIAGIFKWKKHLKKDTNEIYKTSLTKKEKLFYFPFSIVLSLIIAYILGKTGDISPYKDGFTVGLSVVGQIMTVKRCIEQWYFWFIVNFLSLIMWAQAYFSGSKTAAYLIMWFLYLVLSVYFYIQWKKEILTDGRRAY